jgi:hypothetical protein
MTSNKNLPLNKFAFTPGGSLNLGTGDLLATIESSEDRLSVMNTFDIPRDASGLALARDLVDVLLGAIQTMKEDQQAGKLETTLPLKKPIRKTNPLV